MSTREAVAALPHDRDYERVYGVQMVARAAVLRILDAHDSGDGAALTEALLLAVEEVDNTWNDEGDHIEWDSDRLSEALSALRRVYAAYDDRAIAASPQPTGERVRLDEIEAWARAFVDERIADHPYSGVGPYLPDGSAEHLLDELFAKLRAALSQPEGAGE